MPQRSHALVAAGVGLVAAVLGGAWLRAQQEPQNPVAATAKATHLPPEQPLILVTESQRRLRIVPVARGLSHPWGLALLPDGRTMLVTERPGRLQEEIIRDGALDPTPVSGVPTVNAAGIGGLNDVVLHPAFATNQLVFVSYSKNGDKGVTLAVARGTFDGSQLTDVEDIFVAEAWESQTSTTGAGATFGGRMLFGAGTACSM